MPRPALDSEGRVLVDETSPTEDSSPQDDLPLLPSDEPPVRKYMIDKIIRAERRGGGWTVHVKWADTDEVTPEPLSEVLRDVHGHPDILKEVEECKQRYLLEHPEPVVEEPPPRPPTRVQPQRERRQAVLQIDPVVESAANFHRHRAHVLLGLGDEYGSYI